MNWFQNLKLIVNNRSPALKIVSPTYHLQSVQAQSWRKVVVIYKQCLLAFQLDGNYHRRKALAFAASRRRNG